MAYISTICSAFGFVLRHKTGLTTRCILLPATRSFQTSQPVLQDKPFDISFSDVLSKPKIPVSQQGFDSDSLTARRGLDQILDTTFQPDSEEYHLHVYSTKHNTHITFTDFKKSPIISVSTGNLGFKKAQRGTYDAAYQLASHVFSVVEKKGIRPKSLEVVLRDFGEGREAVVKALLGTEGRNLKGAIKRVTDATRLKFGGTRSRKQRRLVSTLGQCETGWLTERLGLTLEPFCALQPPYADNSGNHSVSSNVRKLLYKTPRTPNEMYYISPLNFRSLISFTSVHVSVRMRARGLGFNWLAL